MPVLFDRTCILCGRVLPAEKHSAALCPDCAREVRTEYRYHGEFSVPGADGAAAALCYRGTVKEALHRFKFGGRPQYAAWFAAEMAAVLAAQLDRWQPTCITYLPLGFLRARERGYNQAELLARPIAQSLAALRFRAAQASVYRPSVRAAGRCRPPEECRRLAPARTHSARRRARRGRRRYHRDRLDRRRRRACPAQHGRRLCFRARGRKSRELNRFSPSPLFTFFRLFFIILVYCCTFFCRLWQYRQMKARISGNFIDFSLASDAAIWYDRRA